MIKYLDGKRETPSESLTLRGDFFISFTCQSEGDTALYQTLLSDSRLYRMLFKIDQDLADRECGHPSKMQKTVGVHVFSTALTVLVREYTYTTPAASQRFFHGCNRRLVAEEFVRIPQR